MSPTRTQRGRRAIKAFLNRFSAWALALATVGGLYLSALALNLLSAFWVLMLCAFVIAGVPLAGRKALNAGMRIREYPKLQQELEGATREAAELRAKAAEAAQNILTAKEEGRREGRDQMRGAMLATFSRVPVIYATVNDRGRVALAGRCAATGGAPRRGAHYFAIDGITGEIKGIVKIEAKVDSAGDSFHSVILHVIEPTVERSWQHLAERVEFDTSPPPGIELRRYNLAAEIDAHGRLVNHSSVGFIEYLDKDGEASDVVSGPEGGK